MAAADKLSIAVVGATGFFGRRFVPALLADEEVGRVYAFGRKRLVLAEGVVSESFDLLREADTEGLCARLFEELQPDVIVYLSALTQYNIKVLSLPLPLSLSLQVACLTYEHALG